MTRYADLRRGDGPGLMGSMPVLITDDFSNLDGLWVGADLVTQSHIAVSGGKLLVTPVAGSNIYDSGKGVYTADTESWAAYGANTLENDSGKLHIVYVDHGSGAFVYLNSSNDLASDLTAGQWYSHQSEVYVGAGDSVQRSIHDANGSVIGASITATSPIEYNHTFRAESATECFMRLTSFGAGEEIWSDNETLSPLTFATLVAWRKIYYPCSRVRLKLTRQAGTQVGVILGKDANNYILLFWNGKNYMELSKCVAGVYTPRVDQVAKVDGADHYLELLPTADFQAFSGTYDGDTQIDEAAITDFSPTGQWYAGAFCTNSGNVIDDFRAWRVPPF